jgi:hypothetical protein
MRKYTVAIAAALLSLGLAGAADATPLGASGGLRAAIQDNSLAETVHCVPGWVHGHRWGFGTGCYRPYRSYPYYGFYGRPRVYLGPRLYLGPRVFFGPRVYRRWWW